MSRAYGWSHSLTWFPAPVHLTLPTQEPTTQWVISVLQPDKPPPPQVGYEPEGLLHTYGHSDTHGFRPQGSRTGKASAGGAASGGRTGRVELTTTGPPGGQWAVRADGRMTPGPWRQVGDLKAIHFQTQATTSDTSHKPGIPVNSSGQSPTWIQPPPTPVGRQGTYSTHRGAALGAPVWGTVGAVWLLCVGLGQLSSRCYLPRLSLHSYPQGCRAPVLLTPQGLWEQS